MATSGPMLITELHISFRTLHEDKCSCGRSSPLFYRLWVGLGGDRCQLRPDAKLCSFCFGERVEKVPFTRTVESSPVLPVQFGHKLVLLPDPNATLTDEERADVDVSVGLRNLREWALRHGTGALPYRAQQGLDWEKLAEFQWAREAVESRLLSYPDRFEFIERKDMRQVHVKQRRTPTDAEVSALVEAREFFFAATPPIAADLDLVWVHPLGEKPRTELQVSLCTPNGGLRRLFYSLPK